MIPSQGFLAASLLSLSLAAPAGGEIYRWVDTQGREHFTAELGQVPPAYRGQAQKTEGGNLNRASSSPKGAGDAAERPGYDRGFDASPARAVQPADEERYLGKGEDAWRRELSSLRRRVELLEQGAERCDGSAGIRLSPASDHRAYAEEVAEAERCERTRQDLDLHRDRLDSLEEQARRAGVPPGWLR